MGAIGSLVNSAIDAVGNKNRGTSLSDFLNKFSSAEGTHVNTIDPLHTFEVSFLFEPNSNSSAAEDKGFLKSLADSGLQMLSNAANNMTGGLVGSIINSNKKGVTDSRKEFANCNKHTFLEYLAEANLLTSKDNFLGDLLNKDEQSKSPLELQLGFYVQNITVPLLKIEEGGAAETYFGKIPLAGKCVIPDNNNLIMDIINTKLPLIERIFYPWMREVTLPYWSYESQPYTTATITIDFSKHADYKYIFYGCKPTQINMMQPNQDADSTITRQVTFLFDFMYVTSNLTTCDSWQDKLLDTGKQLLNSGMNMANL